MLDMNCELLSPVFILEDDPLMQDRLQKILQQFGYQSSELFFSQTIYDAKKQLDQQQMQLILVDLGLPDGNGIELIQYIRQQLLNLTVPIMVISAWSAPHTIYQALTAGASGYVLKERDDIDMIFAIRSILRGGAIIDPIIAMEILKHVEEHSPQEISELHVQQVKLSTRELEILKLVADGNSSREIAELKNISKYTVDSHIKKIYQKLDVNSRTKAIVAAKHAGLI